MTSANPGHALTGGYKYSQVSYERPWRVTGSVQHLQNLQKPVQDSTSPVLPPLPVYAGSLNARVRAFAPAPAPLLPHTTATTLPQPCRHSGACARPGRPLLALGHQSCACASAERRAHRAPGSGSRHPRTARRSPHRPRSCARRLCRRLHGQPSRPMHLLLARATRSCTAGTAPRVHVQARHRHCIRSDAV
jgi:hypothetical protein